MTATMGVMRPSGASSRKAHFKLNYQRWRLRLSPADHNDCPKLELPRLGNRWAVEVLAELVRQKDPTILFLMETKLSVREIEPIKTELGYPSMLAVSSEGRKGGLALFWAAGVVVDTQTYSPNHIDANIRTQN